VNKRGGGVGSYLRNDYSGSKITEPSSLKKSIECIFIEIVSIDSNVIVGSVYRPPGSDVADFNYEFSVLLSAINEGRPKPKLTIIARYYNLDLLQSDCIAHIGDFLINVLSHSFLPLIRYPTRITQNSATLFDNIFVNYVYHDIDSAIIYSDISDHSPIAVRVEFKFPRREQLCVPPLKRLYTVEHSIHTV